MVQSSAESAIELRQSSRSVAPATDKRYAPSLALIEAVRIWAQSSTGSRVARREERLHDKEKTLTIFFTSIGKQPETITTADVVRWRNEMEEKGLSANTIYTRISHVSAFYRWAMRDPVLSAHFNINPALLARPRRPKSYQTESTKAYSDEEMEKLLSEIARQARAGSVVAKRDYTLLLIYFLTGLRRNEVITLRGCDVKLIDGGLILNHRQKGGKFMGRELLSTETVEAMLEYLAASGRNNVLGSIRPLWTRHDPAKKPGAQLSSHSLDKNLKRYAKAAGVKDARIHRTRHTFARIVTETTGSLVDAQEALDHDNLVTTRTYVKRIVLKRDKHSSSVAERIRPKKTGTVSS